MRLLQLLFGNPTVYATFQHMLAPEKIERLKLVLQAQNTSVPEQLRVLDLGCGPGIHAGLFIQKEKYLYVGIDSNPHYVKAAAKKYGLDFRCCDVTTFRDFPPYYDLALLSNLIHHLNDAQADAAVSVAASHLKSSGKLIVLELVPPDTNSLSSLFQSCLLHLDNGDYLRDSSVLHDLLSRHFGRIESSDFVIRFLGVPLWSFKLFECNEPISLNHM